MQQPWYATREQVKRALDSAETARNNAQIDRAIAAASRSIDTQMHRRFYPWDGTKYFGFRPWVDGSSSWRLWLNDSDLVSVSTLAVGSSTISSGDFFLEPVNDGPPYRSIEMDLSSSPVFASGETWQRAVAITGTFGWWDEQEAVGELSDALDASASDTANITWTDPRNVGVGSILKVDSERLVVTEMSFVDSTQNTGGTLAASAADVTITVSNSDGFYVGETIRIDSERMLVVDTGTATLTVKRAWDGSVLATHSTSADIYGRTGIEVSRAQLGSSLAAHTASDVVYRYVVPTGINDLCVAEALVQLQSEQSAYAQKEGTSVTRPAAAALRAIREEAVASYGRKARTMAI
jgi:hypothetical protein